MYLLKTDLKLQENEQFTLHGQKNSLAALAIVPPQKTLKLPMDHSKYEN